MKFPKNRIPKSSYEYGLAIDALMNLRHLIFTYKISYQYLAYLLEIDVEDCEAMINNKAGIPLDKICRIQKVNNFLMRFIEEIQEEIINL